MQRLCCHWATLLCRGSFHQNTRGSFNWCVKGADGKWPLETQETEGFECVTTWAVQCDNCRLPTVPLITVDSAAETLDPIQTNDAFDRDTSGTAAAGTSHWFWVLSPSGGLKYNPHSDLYSPKNTSRGEDTDISTAAQLVDDCRMEQSVLKTDEVFVEMWDEAETDASKVFVYRRERRRRKLLKRPED